MNGGGGACSSYVPIIQTINNPNSLAQGSGPNQVYISIGAMCEILNKYIIAKGSDGQPLIRLSVKANEYDQTQPTGSYLYCTAHPLQVSVDPSVCLIKNPLWIGGDIINAASASVADNTTLINAQAAVKLIIEGEESNFVKNFVRYIEKGVDLIKNKETYTSVEELLKKERKGTLQDILNNKLSNEETIQIEQIQSLLNSAGITLTYKVAVESYGDADVNVIKPNSIKIISSTTPTPNATALTTIATKSPQALSNLEFLKKLPLDYFYENKPESEIGVIKNIFVNVDYLYQRALDTGLQSGDQNQRNEISLYNYLKKVISDVQAAIGNVDSFEIHVDPVDNNVARIIDVNYTEPNKSTYDELFELQVHNLNSIVRSYSLQSQIFPNQSALIAIGSQAKGGQMGMQTNTMIDFNRNLTDRIITEKIDGIETKIGVNSNNIPTITNGLANIISLFSSLNSTTPLTDPSDSQKTDYNTLASQAKNSLRDVIVYFQSIVKSPGSNRNLIPTKFSCEMDGIGGLVIGHMFRLPDNIMPRGYRGEGIGSKLGNAITSIGHTISNGDWSTKIDTLNIVLEDSKSQFFSLDLSQIKALLFESIAKETGEKATVNPNTTANFGQVDSSIPAWGKAILDTIAYTEGTARSGQNGYDILVGYNKIPNWTSDTTSGHPNIPIDWGGGRSTAAGRYQFLYSAWVETNGNKNVAINKANQDNAGWKLVKKRIPGGENTAKSSYNIAVGGEKDVNKNEPFLNMLGIQKSGLAGTWASISDRYGSYPYSGQGSGLGTQDIYNIYLEAINKN